MNRIKQYFQSLPISFSSATLVTILIIGLTTLNTEITSLAKRKVVLMHTHSDMMLFPVLNYVTWLLLAPLIYQVILNAQRHSISGSLKRSVFVLLLSFAFMVGHEVVALLFYHIIKLINYTLLEKQADFSIDLSAGLLGLIKTYMEYWVIYYFLGHFHTKQKYRQAELKNAQLESSLFKAQMSALKNQLHPHFLFNMFNTISSLMEEDVELAQRMIAKLGALLRNILNKGEQQFLSLEEELEFIKLYLELEQIRFKGRLTPRFLIDPNARKIQVPALILQPGVENAIKHGFYKKLDDCEISISATFEGEYLQVRITDNGGGVKNERFSFGMGLVNVEERLERCYGDQYRFDARPLENGVGFMLEIRISKEALIYEDPNSTH